MSQDLSAALARGEVAPLYLLCGKERFLVLRALDALRQAVLEPATRDFNQDVLDGRSTTAAAIVAAARTLPMMAQRRFVLVRGIDELKASQPSALEPLLDYLRAPSPSTVLVMTADKVDVRLKLFATLKKAGAIHAFDPPRERELRSFLQAEARARGGSLSESAARLLAELVGADLGLLAQSLEKLILYAGERRIEEEDVSLCIAETRVHSVFELMNAVGEGDREAALGHLDRMLAERESPLGMLAMLTRHFRQLLRVRELVEKRSRKDEIARALGINPYFIDGLVVQARRFTPAALRAAFESLYQTDLQLKSSRLPDRVLLERLLFSLCPDRAAAGRVQER